MNRRHFTVLTATTLGAGLSPVALAQGAPVAGQDYLNRSGAPIVTTPPGTADVVEFFSFACPHCFEFEPTLDAWLARKPAEVRFHRSPVPFLQNYANFQPMYFALEAMGVADSVAPKVFNAVHVEHERLDKPEAISAFMTKNGVDAARFMSLFNSFGVHTKVQQANALFEALDIGSFGVPSLAVQGHWLTSPRQARGEAQVLRVVDYLAAQARSGH